MTTCSIPECTKTVHGRGYCGTHYRRWLTHGDANKVIDRSLAERFYAKVQKGGGTECWQWTGALSDWGYGKMGIDHRTVKAHRVSWELHNGAIPQGMYVLHRCDNPPCTNPAHLFLGTLSDNSNDMVNKKRHARAVSPETTVRGSRHSQAKLNEDQVREIRELFAAGGYTKAGLGRKYGVSETLIGFIVRGQAWAHVSPNPVP